jgi:magnesium chelatase family protein
MSLAVLRSRALAGMEAPAVSVEVHLANGLPGLTSVGTNTPIHTEEVAA